MNDAQWCRIREIFDHVVDKSPSHRQDYLDMVCEDDAVVRQEVELLLAASDSLEEEGSIAENYLKAALAPPTRLGNYELGELLGAGGMGEVYLARHDRHGDVALKLLPVFLVQDPSAQNRFEREARVLGELAHPSLCRLYEYFVTEDYACIAMEYVRGTELSTEIDESPLRYAAALDIVSMLADALAICHARGVTHRDIKPGNVIACDNGRSTVKLVDFGVAKFADLRLTATGQAIGSPRYMSPEQWRGEAVDTRTDIWALGVLWYEMLAGWRPFDGETTVDVASAVLTEEATPLPENSIDNISLAGANQVIGKMLRKDAEARIADCRELKRCLETVRRS